MAPILWLNLFLLFLISLILFMIINYFNFPSEKNTSTLELKPMFKKTWKW